MISDVKGKVDQLASGAPLSNGDMDYPRMSKMGGLYTADWAVQLAMAGKCYSLDLGTAGVYGTGSLEGNHDIDPDQPEFVVAIDTGWLVPISLNISASALIDAAADTVHIYVVADRTQTTAAGITGTVETALNCLDGGDAFGGRCYSICTGSSGTVTEADVLYSQIHYALGASSLAHTDFNAEYEWRIPRFLAGPCSILGYVISEGATQTSEFWGNIVFAHLPVSWITTS